MIPQLAELSSSSFVQSVGWGLAHSLWQIAAVATIAAIALRMLRRAPAQARYLVSCAGLLLMVLLPAVTAWTAGPPSISFQSSRFDQRAIECDEAPSGAVVSAGGDDAASELQSAVPFLRGAGWSAAARFRFEEWLPWIVLAWASGVVVFWAWIAGGWVRVARVTRTAAKLDGEWQRRLDDMARRLGIRRTVAALQSSLVQMPCAIGWLEPVIVVPVSVLAGLPPRQTELILAHELAHVRRHDFLVNVLQSSVEALLFYHPAAWWMSRRVRVERENCCDDLAVSVTGDALGYARALAHLEEVRMAPGRLVIAATGGSLLARVRRLLGLSPERSGVSGWSAANLIVTMLVALTALGAGALIVALGASPAGSVAAAELQDEARQAAPPATANPVPMPLVLPASQARPVPRVPPAPPVPPVVPMPPPPPLPPHATPPAGAPPVLLPPAALPAPPASMVPPAPAAPAPRVVPAVPMVPTLPAPTAPGASPPQAVLPVRPAAPAVPAPPPPPGPPASPASPAPPVPPLPLGPPASPAPPAPPGPLAPPAPPVDPANQQASTSMSRSRGEFTYQWSDDGRRLIVRGRGDVRFSDDDRDVASISDGGMLVIEEEAGGRRFRLDLRPARGGGIDREWFVDGSRREYDAEARAWLARLLPEFIRGSAIGADARVARILKSSGVDGVLAEISLVPGSHAKRRYFEELLAQADLDGSLLRRLLEQASREMASDYELGRVLAAATKEPGFAGEETKVAYARAASAIESDYELQRALSAVVKAGPLTPAAVQAIAAAARTIQSDYESGRLVRALAEDHASEVHVAGLLEIIGDIESAYERSRALLAILERVRPSDSGDVNAVLDLAAGISSDYERARVLSAAARHLKPGPAVASFVRAAGSIRSDYERHRALSAAIRAKVLDPEATSSIISLAAGMRSDYERASLLVELARAATIEGKAREAYIDAANAIRSRYEQDRALAALARGGRR